MAPMQGRESANVLFVFFSSTLYMQRWAQRLLSFQQLAASPCRFSTRSTTRQLAQAFIDDITRMKREIAYKDAGVRLIAFRITTPDGIHDDVGIRQYVASVKRMSKSIGGIKFEVRDIAPEQVEDAVSQANGDDSVHAILVLRPGHHAKHARSLIAAPKDVEKDEIAASAVTHICEQHNAIRGRTLTVINDSSTLGRPLARLLVERHAASVFTIDVETGAVFEHSQDGVSRRSTSSFRDACSSSSTIVVAPSDANFTIPPDWVKPGSVVVNVSPHGDAALDRVDQDRVAVVDHVGAVTVAILLRNAFHLARAASKSK
ncbi:Tetrahydrofolate dehydrogenase/cyclohydrolase NAD(P)-binding domain-containing protein [Plasmodiophora brassicae]